MRKTLFVILSITSLNIPAEDKPIAWTEAFDTEQMIRLKERGIELPSGQKGAKEKQLNDFLNPTQLEMLRSRKAELQYQEQSPEEVYQKYRDRKGRAGAIDRCKRQIKKHPKGWFYPVYHTFAASSFVMDFVTFDIPFIGEDGDQYYIYTQMAYPIKSLQEAEELTKRYERGDFD